MTRLLRRRSAGERGASLVEFALIAPVLFMLLLGMITGGVAYFRQISMTDAVREGARFGATLERSNDWASFVRTRTSDLSGDELTEAQVCVQLVEKGAPGDPDVILEQDPGPCTIGAAPANPEGVREGDCLVKVWAERDSKLEALLFSMNLTLRANSVARFERTCRP